ncbi:MAG: hypothetical protein JWO95_1938 [Verrucomicrobiales bacterium]|nr:hypothetical protein [Verrucomicrobiales bacterium]
MNSRINATPARFIQLLSLIAIVCVCGCYSHDSHGRQYAIRDPLPKDAPKGFADFTLTLDSDCQKVGVLRIGDNFLAGEFMLQITKRGSCLLRMAAPPGDQKFRVASTLVVVPITNGMVTPVEITTRRLRPSIWSDNRNCHISARISPSVPYEDIH